MQETRQYRRKLVTIIALDVEEYTRHMERDDAATLDTLRAYRRVIKTKVEAYHGRQFGVAGDSVMAEFVSPVEAVRCAIEIQREIAGQNAQKAPEQKLRFRIGAHIGDVIVDGEDLFGDDVNIAARLQEASISGGVAISEVVYGHVDGKLDLEFEYLGEPLLKNIKRPIRAYQIDPSAPPPAKHREGREDRVDLSKPVPGFSGRPAIAVLPFDNLGQDFEYAHIADGLAEDIITGLSRFHSFPVIARNSSFMFRGQPMTASKIGRALGARYLLEGSLRLAGDRLRVTAQLVDAEGEINLWCHRFDRKYSNLFDVQDEISRQIICTLETQIDQAEMDRSNAKPAEQLDVWELVRRGMWHQYKLRSADAVEARALFDAALERDPKSVEALIQLSWWYFWGVWASRGSKDGLLQMERLARQAVALDPFDARGHMLVGIAQIMQGLAEQGRGPLLEAVRLNPSLATAHTSIGSSYIFAGEPDLAIESLTTGMRLDPHDLYGFHALGELAAAHLMRGNFEESRKSAEKALRIRPGYWYARVVLIGALARANNKVPAEKALAELIERTPKFSPDHINWLPYVNKKWHDFYMEGLKMAGYSPPDL